MQARSQGLAAAVQASRPDQLAPDALAIEVLRQRVSGRVRQLRWIRERDEPVRSLSDHGMASGPTCLARYVERFEKAPSSQCPPTNRSGTSPTFVQDPFCPSMIAASGASTTKLRVPCACTSSEGS